MRYNITPCTKPRQTRSDKWKQRPCVMRYRAFADEARALGITIPESGSTLIFGLPMPKSWSKKKKAEMIGKPHQQVPDWDNLAKGIQDAVLKQDCRVWDIHCTKIWADVGFIEIVEVSDEQA